MSKQGTRADLIDMKHGSVKSIYLVKQFQLVGTLVEKC